MPDGKPNLASFTITNAMQNLNDYPQTLGG